MAAALKNTKPLEILPHMDKYHDLREAAYCANMELPKLGLVTFTFGNVSAADQAMAVFAIKPSGIPYALLHPTQMVIVDFEGRTVDGKLRPSSDTPTHAVLYGLFAGIGGVCHTHSTYATAWAQSLRDIPIYGTTHADHFGGDIPCARQLDDARIQGDYEAETGYQIVTCLERPGAGSPGLRK